MNTKNKIALEVNQLHQFFQDWFNGELTPSSEEFDRCTNVLAPKFKMIHPDGYIIPRDALLVGLQKANNSRVNMRIWIENIQVLVSNRDLILATYQEWQEIDGKVSARQSSVLFQLADSAPNGVLWLHVHETWINA